MRALIRPAFAVGLMCLAAACGGREAVVEIQAPKTEEERARLEQMMESERQMMDAHMRMLQQNGATAPPGQEPPASAHP